MADKHTIAAPGEKSEPESFLKEYIRVDVNQHSASFYAVKKYLGEKGPFNILDRTSFTVSEKLSFGSGAVQEGNRLNHAHLVLGYGLHSVDYRGHKLYIWYRPVVISNNSNLTSELDVTERITVYVKPFLPAIIKENYTKSQQPKSASTPATATTATAATTQQPSSENSSKKNVQDGDDDDDDASAVIAKPKAAPEPTAPWEVLKAFVNDALDFEHVEDQDETRVFTVNEKLLCWQLATERPKRPMESVFIKTTIKTDIASDIENFLKGKDFYASHGIPFKRGFLFYGPPGCGKTSLVGALAGKFNLSVCLLQIGHKSVTDNVLHSLFMSAPSRSIVLIEDIDTLFVSRNNANTNQSVTFSGFINALDGVGSAEGKIVIVTTNHPSKIDPALLRPGRIDKQYKVDYVEGPQIEEMFLYYFPGKKKKAVLFREAIVGNHITTAEIQQHFIKYQGDADEACKHRHELVDTIESRRHLQAEDASKGSSNSTFSMISLW